MDDNFEELNIEETPTGVDGKPFDNNIGETSDIKPENADDAKEAFENLNTQPQKIDGMDTQNTNYNFDKSFKDNFNEQLNNRIQNRNIGNAIADRGQQKIDRANKLREAANKKEENLNNKLKKNNGKNANDEKQQERIKRQQEKIKAKQEKADKLAEKGKNQVAKGNQVADKINNNPLMKAKKIADMAKNGGNVALELAKEYIKFKTKKIRLIAGIAAVAILLLIIIISVLIEPITDAMFIVKKTADVEEKFNNFAYGLGFENSIDSFNSELEFLDTHYDGEVNEPLLLATLFYDDIMGKGNTESKESEFLDGASDAESSAWIGAVTTFVDTYSDEAYSETDKNGFVYSANKVYRLKDLTKHMMTKGGSSTSTVPISKYVLNNAEVLESDKEAYWKSSVSQLAWPLLLRNDIVVAVGGLLPDSARTIFSPESEKLVYAVDNGYISNTMALDAINNHFENGVILTEDYISMFTDIVGLNVVLKLKSSGNQIAKLRITIGQSGTCIASDGDCNNTISDNVNEDNYPSLFSIGEGSVLELDLDFEVTYKKYSLDEEEYERYLREEYIPKMPEFKEYILDKDGEVSDAKVDIVIQEIKDLADLWEQYYGDGVLSADYRNVCIGNIHPNLIKELALPVTLEVGTEIVFSTETAYGNNGRMHNGVDINEESAGVLPGTQVFAAYDGQVVASSASGDFAEASGTGGWVKISHSITYTGDDDEDVTSSIYTIYGGLDPSGIPTTGSSVTKGQQIGTIGASSYAEDGLTPGLHFGVIDGTNNNYLNPINVFITCSGYDDSDINVESTSCLQVHGVPIKRQEFKDAVEAFVAKYPSSHLKDWDLDEVYTVAARNNINPELLVVRALIEGFSPRYSNCSTCSTNENYWGLGCGNDESLDDCEHYTTMAAGIAGFASASSVRNANTIEQMMGTYAVQTTWYNPGGTYGGCYYLEPEKPYMTNRARIAQLEAYCADPVGNRCTQNGHEAACLPATPDDQLAHVRYNLRDMNAYFSEIFGEYHDIENGCSSSDSATAQVPGAVGSLPPNGSVIIRMPLDEWLDTKGTDMETFKKELRQAAGMAGPTCSRARAVRVATKTLDFLAARDGRLPYQWGWDEGIKGLQSYWGSPVSGGRCFYDEDDQRTYCYDTNGMDCAGFVAWVLNTAGFNVSPSGMTSYTDGTLHGARRVTLVSNEAKLRPGDVLTSSGHVALVVGIDNANNKYITAEAVGYKYGIIYKQRSFAPDGYIGLVLDDFYSSSNPQCDGITEN